MTPVLAPLALLANGLAAGVMVATAIGTAPLALALRYDRYVELIQFMWPRYDPFMPICTATALGLDAVLPFVTRNPTARALFAAAAVLQLVLMAISVLKNVPINRYVMSLDPVLPPPDWTERDPRVRWRNWNLVRTGLSVAALLANVTAVAALL